MKTSFFFRSKVAQIVNILVSIVAVILLELDIKALGFLIGASLVTSLCVFPARAYQVCWPVQIFLIAVLALGLNLWVTYVAFCIFFPALLLMIKDADRVTLLGTYMLSVFVPPLFIAFTFFLQKGLMLFI